MDRSSPEGTSIRITEVSSQGSSVQGKLTGFAEQNAEAEGFRTSSQNPIPDRSQDTRSKAATLQLPVQSPIHRPDSSRKAQDGRRFSIVTISDTSRSGSDGSLTDLAEFRGEFILRTIRRQVIPEHIRSYSYSYIST